ncbi:MAG: hypothetical protein RLZZ502_103, partial [Pseudomonadota bacterium]
VSELNGLYRVRLGPFASRETAQEARWRLPQTLAHTATLVR